MELTAGGKILPEVKIQRGIFHGDAFLLLIFVIVLMSLNRKFRIIQSAGAVKSIYNRETISRLEHGCIHAKTTQTRIPDMILNNLIMRLRALRNVECPFIAIAPKSTLPRSSRTWESPIYGSKRTFWHLNCV